MIKGGYILQPRYFDNSEASRLPPVTRELWFYLLRNVNFSTDGEYRRGSGFFSLKDIQDDLCWFVGYRKMTYSKPQLTKSLRRLREETMIATTKATRGVYVTISKYEEYQDPKNYEGNGEGTTKETRRKRGGFTKNKNVKECKEVKTTSRTKHVYSDKFLSFWKKYPRNEEKFKAYTSWKKAGCENGIFEEIMISLDYFLNSPSWKKENGEFVPHAKTWINGRRWEDDVEPSEVKPWDI